MGHWKEPEEMRVASLAIAIALLKGNSDVRNDVWSIPSKVWMTESVSRDGEPDWTKPDVRVSDFRPTPAQMLALEVLRGCEDQSLLSALVDEVQSIITHGDDPVTEEWCKTHMHEDADCFFLDETGTEPGYCVTVSLGCNVASVYSYDGEESIELILRPTVSQVISLCRTLNIPWRKS